MKQLKKMGAQRGMALIFAMVALIALTVGAVALIRSVDSGVLALGNLAFKQSGVTAGASATEAAMAYLQANLGSENLNSNRPDDGYYATQMASLDVTGRTAGSANVLAMVNWNGDGCKINGKDVGAATCTTKPSKVINVGGDQVSYIITRLCRDATAPAATECATPVTQTSTQALGRGALDYGSPEQLGVASYSPYYRIITRTVGPKGTVSFTETLVHF